MRSALVYTRVSSRDQEREGYSIPAQQKSLRAYAQTHDLEVLREFVDVETAKSSGRKQFGEMIRFFKENPTCRIVLAEKTDRLYRNFHDYILLEDLEIEIHLPKEGLIISKEAKSQTKLVHGIQVVIARNYIENLREEVRKGMREKAEQGIYPSRPPLGYANNKLAHTIEVDPQKAPLARRMFELYATGNDSLSSLQKAIQAEFGQRLAKGYLERLLKNPFYVGLFVWEGKTYTGTHSPLITINQFEQVQAVFRGRNKPKYRKHEFAFRGLLTCAYDNCLVTAEIKKAKYIYYRCTQHRGKCALSYFREEELGNRLGQILKDIHIPDEVFANLQSSLLADKHSREATHKQQQERLQERLALLRRRMEQIYLDKLDGRVSEELWLRKSAEWQQGEQQVLMAT